jgi:CheY-like chemotaxis protein
MLRSFGYQVLEAADGAAALALAEEYAGRIDLLITDMVMPVMSGSELSAELRRRRPEIQVLYISGYTGNMIAQQGLSEEGVAFLQKPFNAELLAGRVHEVLRNKPADKTLLVVDDDPAVRALFHQFLLRTGFRVMEAANGSQALAAVRQGGVDLVITDLVMPEKEGIETIVEIHKNYPEVKIVAVSGAFGGEYLKVASMLGAAATLLKPVSEEVLVETVQRLLGDG